MTDKERKFLEEAGLLHPAQGMLLEDSRPLLPNCVEYYQTLEEIAKKVVDDIFEAINDKVQVVRCKDCKHYWKNKPSEDVPVCLASPREDAYCSEGERREDDPI